MFKSQWLLALPLVLASTLASTSTEAATIRDQAGMFSPEAVNRASAKLDQVERDSGMRITIETVASLNGRTVHEAALDHARRSRTEGIYVLIAQKDHKINALVSPAYKRAITAASTEAIERAFIDKMRQGDADDALLAAAEATGREVSQAKATTGGNLRGAVPVPGDPVRGRRAARPASGMSSLLMIGLLIVGGLFLFRLLGNLFGAGRGYGAPGRMGAPGYGPGYGGGGGFWSSMFGGIGGAMAGNWLYDQFSGRHHGGGYTDTSSYGDPGTGGDVGGGDWAGGDGGDWGGGGGGGGDWGGGGGDGGGGDW